MPFVAKTMDSTVSSLMELSGKPREPRGVLREADQGQDESDERDYGRVT